MIENKNELKQIQKFVGPVKKEQLKNIEYFLSENAGLFLPVTGPCYYSITPEHIHPGYMIVFSFNDVSIVKIEDVEYKSNPGTFYVVSPYVKHQEIIRNGIPRYYALIVDKNYFDNVFSKYCNEKIPIFTINEYEYSNRIIQLLKDFSIECSEERDKEVNLSELILNQICHRVVRIILNIKNKQNSFSNKFAINNALYFMQSNINRNISTSLLASAANLSVFHFCRLFKQETGKTPMNYLSGLRLERVKKLLLENDKPLTDIALECGFNSSSYLSERFKKHFNITPSEYRRISVKKQNSMNF